MMKRSAWWTWAGITLGALGAVAGAAIGLWSVVLAGRASAAREPLVVRLDPRGPYLILATGAADRTYADAIAKAKALHPGSAYAVFDPRDLAAARQAIQKHRPRYAMVFLEPRELDLNFAWSWLTLTTQVDSDPLVDVCTGFITGATPADAAAFVGRIAAAVGGQVKLPGSLIDNLGPNPQAGKDHFYTGSGAFMVGVFADRFGLTTISHGPGAFTDDRLGSMDGAGLIHVGGHGHPDRVDDGVTASQIARMRLAPCVVFNGCCYTGATHRWFDVATGDGRIAEKTASPAESFCLQLLRGPAIAYLAAVHPDHGIPVYQEMEYLAFTGASLGEAMKHTHDGVVLGSGGQLPKFERFAGGMPRPVWSESEFLRKGTASRVLFGDPSLIVIPAFTDGPFKVTVDEQPGALRITAAVATPRLVCTYADTYHTDLSGGKGFNDRARIVADLPESWDSVRSVEVVSATAGGKPLPHRLVGWAVEHDGARRRLHAQVDVPSTGYMQSPFRAAGASVVLKVRR